MQNKYESVRLLLNVIDRKQEVPINILTNVTLVMRDSVHRIGP